MSLRLLVIGVTLALGLAGCAHDGDWLAYDQAREDARTAIASENGAISNGYPVPVGPAVETAAQTSWGEPLIVPANLTGPQAVADGDGPYLLDTGDRLRVFVYGQPNLSRLYTVDHGGTITVPLIGAVKARGLTTAALEGAIRARLGTQYVRDPQVTVDVQQNRPFFILGEVRNAGQYPYVSGMTVETAVAIAGGYTERASDRKFRLTRRINGLIEQIEAPSDYVVKPGDTVFVFERLF
jgi:polysaccharide export outer membrane protein